MKKIREVVFYRGYFERFYQQQAEKVRQKIDYVLFLVVLFNGFQKKTMKTPKEEIKLALKLMNEYLSANK